METFVWQVAAFMSSAPPTQKFESRWGAMWLMALGLCVASICGGCNLLAPFGSPSVAMGRTPEQQVVSAEEVDTSAVAEALVEGAKTDGDKRVRVGGYNVRLVGKVGQDFAAIHSVATACADEELAVAAALAAVLLAPDEEASTGYQLLAQSLEAMHDGGLAVELAERRLEFVAFAEHHMKRGFEPGAVMWRDACFRRGIRLTQGGLARFEQACGWLSDDEDEIAIAMVELLEAAAVMQPAGLSASDAIALRHGISKCENELWGSHAKSTRASFAATLQGGKHRFNAVIRRLSAALQYTQFERTTDAGTREVETGSWGGYR